MINQVRLEQYIANPALLDEKSVEGLWQLVKEFPYFQTARLLLAKNLSISSHDAYPLSLRLAAAYAGDRGLLKHLIETGTFTETVPAMVSAEENVVVPEPEVKEESLLVEPEPEINEETVLIEPVPEVKEEAVIIEPEPEEEVPGVISEAEPFVPEPELVETAAPEPVVEPAPEVVSAAIESPPSFTREELIDKFIREEPRISQAKKEFFNAEDHARLSIVEHDDLVSETLAMLYARQGLKDKAIKIYQKLMLLIPEKSSYFAARIEEMGQNPK